MKKLTYVEALEVAIETVESVEVKEKLEALKNSLKKKNSSNRKPTANQLANISLKKEILDFMERDKAYTITEIMKGCEAVAELSNQKVSALMRQLVESGEIDRNEVKRKAYFSLAEGDDPNQFLPLEVTV